MLTKKDDDLQTSVVNHSTAVRRRKSDAKNNFNRVFFNKVKHEGRIQNSEVGGPKLLSLGRDYFSYALFAFYLFDEEDIQVAKV